LGADVPFFLVGQNAFGEGVGEVLTPVALPPAWYVVLVPPISVATAGVFTAPELTRNTKTIKISSFSAGVGVVIRSTRRGLGAGSPGNEKPGMDPDEISLSNSPLSLGWNDLEPVVCKRYPQVAQHLEWLKAHAAEVQRGSRARMSGSGACVFAEFATEQQARSVVSSLPAGMSGFAARGMDRHPLQELLEQG
jgi:4-diphosphocytidyl-2-C-methyl-D-erythritol kinase